MPLPPEILDMLAQQGQRQMQNANAMPNPSTPQAMPTDPSGTPLSPDMGGASPVSQNAPQPQQPQGGPLKKMLTNFAGGLAEYVSGQFGMSPQQRQYRTAELQQAQAKPAYTQAETAGAQATTAHTEAQTAQMGQTITLPNGVTMPYGLAVKAFPAYFQAEARQNVANQNNQTKRDISQATTESKETLANQADQTKRDLAGQNHELGRMKLDAMVKLGQQRNNIAAEQAAVSRGRLDLARSMGGSPAIAKVGMGAYDDALLADKRLQIMQDAQANPNGQNDVALLFNHIGMTLSAQKGARITNAEIERAIKTRSLPQELQARWDQVQNGQFLTPEQRQQMVELGVTNRNVAWENAERKANYYGVTKMPAQAEGLPPIKSTQPAHIAPVAPPRAGFQTFMVGGKPYVIPKALVDDFKRDHPDAQAH